MTGSLVEAGPAALARGEWEEARDAFQATLDRAMSPQACEGIGINGAELVALVGGGMLVAALGARWKFLPAGALPAAVAALARIGSGARWPRESWASST